MDMDTTIWIYYFKKRNEKYTLALLYPINYASASFLLLDSSCHQSMRTLLNLQYLTNFHTTYIIQLLHSRGKSRNQRWLAMAEWSVKYS